ncbi:hypothetical protein AtubIFM56815_002692 [Aspergillus tubingensis]|uniref:Uncharacterized protein n=2 Tax=Aspergillus subgen. Circumdati TaxID=2720871 RepID=A0A9W6AX29_ASPTU|nr:similar to An01g07840 [Aspergillus niger]GLA61176.1 hypothetical protein AtubIFM54640_001690 [Aspergillus tubingensis]GLA88249.1 hypothetical protein AtubIFM56815_002692 [Aspergillus tubingensis]GLB15361.1 hypothetical protein AtubIFM61612_005177 [Aspergillus tubingensis]
MMRSYGRELCAIIARLLDHAKIPNVLWNEYMLSAYGAFTPEPHDISFIVPNRLLDAAYRTLQAAGFTTCPESHIEACSRFQCPEDGMIPARHFHIASYWIVPACTYYLKLYGHAETLFSFPEPTLNEPSRHDKYYMSTRDERLPPQIEPLHDERLMLYVELNERAYRDPYELEIYKIKIPNLTMAIHALILLRCRDEGYNSHCDDDWYRMLSSIRWYVVQRGKMQIGRLEAVIQPIWDNLEQQYGNLWIRALRKKLKRERVLPLPFVDRGCRCFRDLDE